MTMLALGDGAVFANRYRIVRCIAQGGMGAVYEAIHLETERRRALKVMLPHIVGSEELRDRFKREARVAAQIESEFIVDVFDAGVDEATQMPFLVMELLKGEELGKRLERVGRFSPPEVVSYLHQTALALDKTHRANIVHRDLKPENLFLTEREDGAPRIKVLDFGIAKLVADGSTQANATRSVGTPLYMSPEQFKSGTKVSPASDIYALGMMSYTLLVGAPYWADEASGDSNVFAFAATVMNGPREAPSVRAQRKFVQLPPSFDHWFSIVCAAEPTQRFQTASQAVAALGEALGLPPIPVGLSASSAHLSGSMAGAAGPLAGSRVAMSAGGITTSAAAAPPAKSGSAGVVIGVLAAVILVGGGLGAYVLKSKSATTPEAATSSAVTAATSAAPPPVTATVTATAIATSAPVASAPVASATAPPVDAASAAASASAAAVAAGPKGKLPPGPAKPPPPPVTAKTATPATAPSYSRD
jgi:serine/threonine-protein kinase